MDEMKFTILSLAIAALICSCSGRTDTATADNIAENAEPLGNFSADSAYRYVAEQVAFGPRVPGTDRHEQCRDYLVNKLRSFGPDSIIIQQADLTAFNGDVLPSSNIIAMFNKEAKDRILLAAHWDTRPWADRDPDPEKHDQPVLGANDGASGVAVLLEVARNLQLKEPTVGVDIIFFDSEDYGTYGAMNHDTDGWCLGSKYWVENMVPYEGNALPDYGILLDMVGNRDALFHYEQYSTELAATPTIKVWAEADNMGYSDRFLRNVGGAVIDDHVYLNNAGIPTTNIIEMVNVQTGSFFPAWHTTHDDMSNISLRTLGMVGNVVLNVVYREKPGD